jgi:hypothetical protein
MKNIRKGLRLKNVKNEENEKSHRNSSKGNK